MDLRLYFRVLWRFRAIVGIGLLLACALAFFSYARVSFAGGSPKIAYRQAETWRASSLVFLTQKGFPYGYTVLPLTTPSGTTSSSTAVPQYASPGTFTQLAQYYAFFTQSDAFQAMLRARVQVNGFVQAQTVLDPAHQFPLPYITIFGYAGSPNAAVALANAGSQVFASYLVRQQTANGIPPAKRVVAETISRARSATISTGRKKTTPIVVFLTVLLAAIGLAFVLENLRPRIHEIASAEDVSSEGAMASARRPA